MTKCEDLYSDEDIGMFVFDSVSFFGPPHVYILYAPCCTYGSADSFVEIFVVVSPVIINTRITRNSIINISEMCKLISARSIVT